MSAWQRAAACRGYDPEWWFAALDSPAASEARRICAACPVQAPCLARAMDAEGNVGKDSRYGIFAGLSGMQRRRLLEQRRRIAQRQGAVAA